MLVQRAVRHGLSSIVLLTGISATANIGAEINGVSTHGNAAGHDHKLCEGILPKNELKIPVFTPGMGAFTLSGLTEEEFTAVLNKFEAFWKPRVETADSKLLLKRYWSSPTVNASADVDFNGNRIINMYGGLARHRTITKDGFLLVACHELGHHIAGAPKSSGFGWASNEGQSDYYGTLRCFRMTVADEDSTPSLVDEAVPEIVRDACKSSFTDTRDQGVCVRSAMAGKSLANLFADPDVMGGPEPKFDTPDTNLVERTVHSHPRPQCRLDTYFSGAVCALKEDQTDDLNESDPFPGTCHALRQANGLGLRPGCWFADSREHRPPTDDPTVN